MRKIILIFAVLGVYILGMNGILANGCCFDRSTGFCSMNIPYDSCDTGEWSGDASCTRSECKQGCCVLGTNTIFTTEQTCILESRAKGFEPNWQGDLSADLCSSLAGGQDLVACVYSGEYENQCKFIERKNCLGTAYPGLVCSDLSLNTVCKKTSKTKCFDDGVYYVDSCGNRDVLVKQCDYESGTMCKQKSSNEAYCKDLNCVDKWGEARKNGESWCIGLDGLPLELDVRSAIFKKPAEKEPSFSDSVGSRFFKQVCIDGEVIDEPCADYRTEVCVMNGTQAKCIANHGESCYEANVFDEELGTNAIEDCDPEWCYMSRLDDCVSFPGHYEPGTSHLKKICAEERANWRDYAGENGLSTEGVLEVSSDLMTDLGLVMCLPKIATGSYLTEEDYYSDDGTCTLGDYEANIVLDHDKSSDRYWVRGMSQYKTTVNKASEPKQLGNAGIISLDLRHWRLDKGGENRFDFCERDDNPLRDAVSDRFKRCMSSFPQCDIWCGPIENSRAAMAAAKKADIPDPVVLMKLNERTIGLGDCAGSSNWIGASRGTLENGHTMNIKDHGSGGIIVFTLIYKSKSWFAPPTGDCSQCGGDGLPCSEYRCKSIAKRCEYREPEGIDSGICVSSDDFQPPQIKINQDPSNPIPPYSSVRINITTDEDSYCRLGQNSPQGRMENLEYETSGRFGRTHEFILSVPGRAVDDEDMTEYPFLTRDGKYKYFIGCEDGAGNFNAIPMNLEVADTPDGVPPNIIEFIPPTNGFAKFNTTDKEIKFRLDEPAECKWSFEDKPYNLMEESFACDSLPSEQVTLNGAYCTGILRNVTLDIGKSTKYYIRCKDQLILEGKEDELYKRNVNERSFEYLLRPSLDFEITEVYPLPGNFLVKREIGNITYSVKTKDGADRGRAQCEWRLRFGDEATRWQYFTKTNSSNHEVVLTTLKDENYIVDVRCEDIAGNKANVSSELNVIVDTSPPLMTRIYNDRGNIRIVLNEPATCKVMNRGSCQMVSSNGTLMSSSNGRTEFTTQMVKATNFIVRCEDDFGNSRCFDKIIFH